MENSLLYSWKFSDKKDRSPMWYVIAFSIVVWIVIWWILTTQYILSFIVFLVSGITLLIENNSEENIEVKLTSNWIDISGWFYDYSIMSSYSVVYSWEDPVMLRLFLNTWAVRQLDLSVDKVIINDIKSVISNFVAESDWIQLSVSEKVIKKLNL